MDDKSLNLWRQIDGFRRRGAKRAGLRGGEAAPAAIPNREPSQH